MSVKNLFFFTITLKTGKVHNTKLKICTIHNCLKISLSSKKKQHVECSLAELMELSMKNTRQKCRTAKMWPKPLLQ